MPLPPYSVTILPGTRGYFAELRDHEADPCSAPIHETDSFGARIDALEAAEVWIDRRVDDEAEARRQVEDGHALTSDEQAREYGVGGCRQRA